MRRIGVLLLLVLGLAVLVGLNQLVNNWHYVLSGEPGDLLYVATFDGFADEWDQYAGILEARVGDGSLVLDVGDIDRLPYSAARPYFTDFDLRVEASAVDGPLNNGYGVVFRLQDPDNHYLFLVSSDGYYQVRRRINGVDKKLSDWIKTPLINEGIGATNWLRVVGRGDHFQFFINGQQVDLCVPNNPEGESTYSRGQCVDGNMIDTLVDDSLASGQLGPAALTLDEPGVVVVFDNVIVFMPEEINGTES